MNREYSLKIITELLKYGVQEFYVCAGARDIPLIETVHNIQSKKQIVFSHFEERSAAFYALGRIKSLNKPVAVITTSGTAVAELLPAAMEAYYSGLPLILITADRPKSYRGTGAPQAAEQNQIFGVYVEKCFDLDAGDEFHLQNISFKKPIHVNVCFDIPLQSGLLQQINLNNFEFENVSLNENHKDHSYELNTLKKFIDNSKNLITLVSQLDLNNNKSLISFLNKLNVPVYLESLSNIRENEDLNHLKIKCPDKLWENAKKSNFQIDSILKIGGTPTHRIWRELDESFKNINVLSINVNGFSGIPHAKNIKLSSDFILENFNFDFAKNRSQNCSDFLKSDHVCYEKLLELIHKYHLAEQSIHFHLSNLIKENSHVYLGNSLPIRYWDLAANYNSKNLKMNASRGVNGIDGQISTFLGFANELSTENWGIFGDLTALYDMVGYWMLKQRTNLNANIVIINNGGGKIFNTVLKDDIALLCQNNHNLKFEHLAKFWNMEYELYFDARNIKNTPGIKIIEIIPDQNQTESFLKEFHLI
ncbi:2-succinyl-5-enolpyruvyl-6-hydroxy-3-cyclohexene-1-carboxylic-acid synthase [Silvanigrella aquatica]|uniref:2-succinyl-5-enolpyruvyl-6-hydroxy-3-cyclohexene-1-carboxylic-acid synthase n=1 Tax=Silvanigrella aquatica TaxID=1915309 RepID=A0A1L4D3W8_9BACT|nr:2-succinyl-5-enolpyruvyl-6-hydroxy-3-cyclohexene-1-carboxylic-acid synthase [Silvanigrella aquatica]APJ04879.1 2-succinyl-5-enolpyruvyl-6-hydroxy-3-cyclohexene-1-carboxylic-acid synthase [Silvanigrella aquatica]